MCHTSLFRSTQQRVIEAVQNACIFRLSIANNSVHARIGIIAQDTAHIFTHFAFFLTRDTNGHVIDALLRQSGAVRVDSGDVMFTFSATWNEKKRSVQRMGAGAAVPMFNALLVLVIMLKVLLSGINDAERTGVDTDVPSSVRCAAATAAGAGVHVLAVIVCGGLLNTDMTGHLALYALLAPICGASSSATLRELGGSNRTTAILVALLAPLLLPIVALLVADLQIMNSTYALLALLPSILAFTAERTRIPTPPIALPSAPCTFHCLLIGAAPGSVVSILMHAIIRTHCLHNGHISPLSIAVTALLAAGVAATGGAVAAGLTRPKQRRQVWQWQMACVYSGASSGIYVAIFMMAAMAVLPRWEEGGAMRVALVAAGVVSGSGVAASISGGKMRVSKIAVNWWQP